MDATHNSVPFYYNDLYTDRYTIVRVYRNFWVQYFFHTFFQTVFLFFQIQTTCIKKETINCKTRSPAQNWLACSNEAAGTKPHTFSRVNQSIFHNLSTSGILLCGGTKFLWVLNYFCGFFHNLQKKFQRKKSQAKIFSAKIYSTIETIYKHCLLLKVKSCWCLFT